ncbi:MAG: capsular polysaccharide biosynthesis protein [bacterium]|nr:capsular polysaccharide biosynthesis protein [bacterium]
MNEIYFLFGFSIWKKRLLKPFFLTEFSSKIYYCDTLFQATRKGLDKNSKVFIWGVKDYYDENLYKVISYLEKHAISFSRVEDGFIRSVNLGSAHYMPYSLILDSRGIYYDSRKESDLENIYNNYDFNKSTNLFNRTSNLIKEIITLKISKYNHLCHDKLNINREGYDKVILIPGQVADDASIKYGGCGMDNEQLIAEVRKNNPNSFLIYKQHPDVSAGYRLEGVEDNFIYNNCNLVLNNVSIDSCIDIADEIHTISSLCGFEALIRDKKVVTYGLPFYAGWGVTEDKQTCARRMRKLTVTQLVAGALILYPKYINPKTKQLCTVEIVIDRIIKEQKLYFSSPIYRIFKYINWKKMRFINEFIYYFTQSKIFIRFYR